MAVPLILSEVPDVAPYIQYIATNGQTTFPYPFPITQDSDLIVVQGGTTLNTDSGYSLTGQGDDTGGNVIFNSGQTAGTIITLYRDIAIERISQIAQNSGFSSTTFNAEFNNIYLILQQLESSIAQCLQIPNTNNPAPVTTLASATYAGKYLAFDQYGNPTAAALTSSGTITTALINSLLTSASADVLAPFFYPITAAETSASITPTNYFYPPGNLYRYGAAGNGQTIDSTAFSNAIAQSLETNGAAVHIPAGVFPVTYTFSGVATQLRIYGESPLTSILVQPTTTADVITFAAGASIWGITFENFAIQGNASMVGGSTPTAGSGIHYPSTMNFPPFLMVHRNLAITGMGRSAIYDQMGVFNSNFDEILASTCPNHLFDIMGGNSLSFSKCYASVATQTAITWTSNPSGTNATLAANWTLGSGTWPVRFSDNEFRAVTLTNGATTATWSGALSGSPNTSAVIANAGYRVHNGRPIFDGCNGLNSGNYWGIFSDNTTEDGTTQYCLPTFLGCNIESFTITGVRNKQAGVVSSNTSWVSHLAGNKAMEITPLNTALLGPLDGDSALINTAGSFANSCAVHVTGTSGCPFSSVGSPENNNQLTWYDEVQATTVTISTDQTAVIRSNRYAKSFYDLYVQGLLKVVYSGTATFSGVSSLAISFSGLGIPAAPDSSYKVLYGMNAASSSSILVPWTTSKATSGFTINTSANYTGTIDWMCVF